MDVFIQIIQLLLSLSILVVLHEFGHYATAKFFGCRVEKFYLFMDWKFALFKKKIGETEFGIGWLPLGGYVKIAGFIDESMDTKGVETAPQPWELRAKPAWQRLIVMLGGIFVNVVLAWFIYSMSFFILGKNTLPIENLKDGFTFNSSAEKLGFQDNDIIVSVDNKQLKNYSSLISSNILFGSTKKVVVERMGRKVTITINQDSINSIIKNDLSRESANGPPFIQPNFRWEVGGFANNYKGEGLMIGDRFLAIDTIKTDFISVGETGLLNNHRENLTNHIRSFNGSSIGVTVERRGQRFDLFLPVDSTGKIGVYHNIQNVKQGEIIINSPYYEKNPIGLFSAFKEGAYRTNDVIKMYVGQVVLIFSPSTGGYKHVGGVDTIRKLFPKTWDWANFWALTAFLSIILAVMNLLPIPALDGGHALIAFGEMVTGRKLPIKVLMPLQIAGMVILFALMIYANGMDLLSYF